MLYLGLFTETINLLIAIWQNRDVKLNPIGDRITKLLPPRYIHAYTIELLFGFLAIELLATIIFKNNIGYVIPRYYTFPVILVTIIGLYNLVRAFINFMNRRILIIQFIDLLYMIFIVGIYWMNHWGWFQIFWIFLPIILNPILEIVIWLLPPFRHELPLWDGRIFLQRFFPSWIHVLLFVICLLETALQYRGYSVLVWA